MLVLQGGEATIARFKPTMMFEIDANHLRRHNHTIVEVESILRAHGYRFYLWRNEALEPLPELQNGNIFCIPATIDH